MTQPSTDIAIIGTGIVGIMTAIAFAKRGYSVAIADVKAIETLSTHAQKSLNARSLALSLSSQKILQAFDCWDNISSHCKAIHDIHVSSKGHLGATRINRTQVNCDALGYVIEDAPLFNTLLKQAQQYSQILFLPKYLCTAINPTEKGCELSFSHNDESVTLNSTLTLICDGALSKTRALAGFTQHHYDYKQFAITANVQGTHSDNHIAFERFTAQGPMALLPLTNKRYGLVWTVNPQQHEALMQANEAEFLHQLHNSFGFRLGKLTHIGERHSFPLHKIACDSLIHKHCVVLGNAAHNLHPVAGQSLNLALRDIAHLYDSITNLEDISEKLAAYNDKRMQDHQQVEQLSDGLVQLFSNNLAVLNHLRAASLSALDRVEALKNNFAWRGMGYGQPAANAQSGQLYDN